ncbi:helix-turn-helix transcriptional regulator [Rhodococcus sp. W8901]|uniref:helix-turn-helix transcriptional regulator n=1 Tax=Rhodococcus sp. W8901 TaxID=2742603 RepID=UPI0015843B55|nr:LuxR C-terminal-related transcriptional regulator [Rhodococcus sp. W8901]QKT09420.1 hypothetical protein HUN07_00525 [Rhodococcus sp. W8901]
MILDDVPPSEPLDRMVSELLAQGLGVIVAGRGLPAIGLQRRIGRREVTVLGFDDLTFDDAETTNLIASRLPDRNALDASLLREYTGGWPAVTDLIIDMSERMPPDADISKLASNAKEYIRTEVVDALPHPQLRAYAILGQLQRFDIELATDALDDPTAVRKVRELCRSHGLVLAAPDRRGWFHLPPVIREVLNEYPEVLDIDDSATILRRASLWYERNGMWEDAFDYMLRTAPEDVIAQVQRMLRVNAPGPLGLSAPALRTFEKLPEGVKLVPSTILVLANTLIQNDLTDEAANMLSRVDPHRWVETDQIIEYYAALAFAHRCRFDHERSAAAATSARLLLSTLVGCPDSRRAYLAVRSTNQLIDVRLWEGDLDSVRSLTDSINRDIHMAASPISTVRFVAATAILALDSGDTATAEFRARESINEAARLGISGTHVTAEAHFTLGSLALESGDLAGAVSELEHARSLAAQGQFPTIVARIELTLAECAAAERRWDDASHILEATLGSIDAVRAAHDVALHRRTAANALALHTDSGAHHRARATFEYLVDAVRSGIGPFTGGAARAALRYALRQNAVEHGPALIATLAKSPEPIDTVLTHLGRAWLSADRPREAAASTIAALEIADRWGLYRTISEYTVGIDHILRSIVDDPGVSAEASGRVVRRARDLLNRVDAEPFSLLSEREIAVAALLPTRLTNKEMAAELWISANTMKTHVRHIYEKLGVTRRIEAVDRLVELGILRSTHGSP